MLDEIKRLRENYGDYYLALNTDFNYVPYQQEIVIPALEAVERGEIRRLMIFMPPGHAKSDLSTRNFIPWYLGRHPDRNAMVCSYAASLSTDDFGSRVKEKMQNPLHLSIFPRSKITKDSRSKTLFRTISGGTFYSVGFGGGMAGKRVDLMILDDLIKNDEEADSDVTQNFLFAVYSSVAKARLRPRGAIVFCIHRWRTRDIAGRILEIDGTIDAGGRWTIVKLKAEDPPGKYLWPEQYDDQHYADNKIHEDSWQAMWQQEPEASRSFWFHKDWLQFYDIPISPSKYNTYMLVDPAGAKGKKSDKSSIQVWAAGQDRKLFLADWIHDRLDPGERVDAIMRLTRKWNQRQTIYEQYGLVNDSYYITEKMREAGFDTRLYPIPVGRSGPEHLISKNERIKGIVPLFKEGRIFLPKKFEVTLADGKKVDLTKRFIDEEYSRFKGEGSIAHEDDLDCMSRIRAQALNIQYYEPPPEKETPQICRGAGTWESVW
jgi:hypothetical protein